MKRLLPILIALFVLPSAHAAWTAQTATCLTQSEAAATTTLTCTVATANIEVGNVAVVNCSTDNTGASGNSNTHSPVTDSAGNAWTKAYEFTEGTGGAGGGATVSVHFSKLTTQLTSGSGTITCNFASVTDKAMHLIQEYTITAGNVVTVAGTPQGAESNGGDAPSQTISGLDALQEYLFVRVIATESNAALSMTATALFSLPDDPTDGCNNTTGGGEASDMGACSEWRILVGATNTSDPTLVDTTNDNASVFVALLEAAPPVPPACVNALPLLGAGCN